MWMTSRRLCTRVGLAGEGTPATHSQVVPHQIHLQIPIGQGIPCAVELTIARYKIVTQHEQKLHEQQTVQPQTGRSSSCTSLCASNIKLHTCTSVRSRPEALG